MKEKKKIINNCYRLYVLLENIVVTRRRYRRNCGATMDLDSKICFANRELFILVYIESGRAQSLTIGDLFYEKYFHGRKLIRLILQYILDNPPPPMPVLSNFSLDSQLLTCTIRKNFRFEKHYVRRFFFVCIIFYPKCEHNKNRTPPRVITITHYYAHGPNLRETRNRACGRRPVVFSVEDAKQTRDDVVRQILSYRLLNDPSP